MLKRLLGPQPGTAFLSKLAAGYIRLVYATSKHVSEPEDTDSKLYSQHPQLVSIWHGQFMLMPTIQPKRRAEVKAMVSRHGDAELLGEVLRRFGTELIRGAGAGKRKRNRGGATAMRETLRALESGASVVMTADVPPGPARRAGIGIVTIAARSGRPVVASAIATSRYVKLSTWSAFTINLPFSKMAHVVGEPIFVPDTEDPDELEKARQAIERALAEATARAYELAGATDPLSEEEASKPGLSLKTYRLATLLAAPVAPLLLAWRTRKGKEERDRRPERYGIAGEPRPEGFLVWFHAAICRRSQRRAAGDRAHRNDAAGRPHPADNRHGDIGTPRARTLARGRDPPICTSRPDQLYRALPGPLASRPCRSGGIGDLAEPGARDEGERRSAPTDQRPHVGPVVSRGGGGGRA